MKNRIFIAGCGRSGTTLLLKLMRCFQDVYTVRTEADVSVFDELMDRPEANVVIKRKWYAYKSLSELDENIRLIYCVRNPLDVMTSKHRKPWKRVNKSTPEYYIQPDRWIGEFESLLLLRDRQPRRFIRYVRYEDLVSCPPVVQFEIANHFGLKKIESFENNSEGIPISKVSLNKYKKNKAMWEYLEELPDNLWERFREFGKLFHYSIPSRSES